MVKVRSSFWKTLLHARPVRAALIVRLAFSSALVCLGSPESVRGDVRIAPLELYLNNENPMGRILVENLSNEPREIEVAFRFGYPVSDGQGNISMYYADSLDRDSHSAAAWIRSYPRRLVLLPGQQQTIRVAARPPTHLDQGEYWVRAIISSRPTADGTEQAAEVSGPVTTRINVAFKTVIAIVYRSGSVHTGVELLNIQGSIDKNRLRLLADLKRSGNGAYRGNLVTSVKSADGRIVKTARSEIAVYYQLRRHLDLDLSGIPRGAYTAEVELNTDREGNSPGDIVRSTPVSKSLAITVP